MLIHKIDMDRAFDLTIKKTHPYLIFSHDDFKLKLSSMLSSLFQYYSDNSESSEIKFEELNAEIEKMLSEVQLDSHNEIRVYDFKYRQMTLDQAQREINKRMIETDKILAELGDIKTRLEKLELGKKTKRKDSDLRTKEECQKTMVNRASIIIDETSSVTRNEEDFSIYSQNMRKSSVIYKFSYALFNAGRPLHIDEIIENTGFTSTTIRTAYYDIKKQSKSATYGILKDHIIRHEDKTTYEWI